MLLDTCFLIDLQRDFHKDRDGAARKFLREHPNTRFSISVISATKFLEGFEEIAVGDPFLRPFTWIELGAEIAREAGRIRRELRLQGNLIGDFDILIAATAIVSALPLVTDNTEHFQRIRLLDTLNYKAV